MAKRRQYPNRRLVRIELADFKEVTGGALADRQGAVVTADACSRDGLNQLWLRHFDGEPPARLPLELLRWVVRWRLQNGPNPFDRSTRKLLVVGATSVIRRAQTSTSPSATFWGTAMTRSRPTRRDAQAFP